MRRETNRESRSDRRIATGTGRVIVVCFSLKATGGLRYDSWTVTSLAAALLAGVGLSAGAAQAQEAFIGAYTHDVIFIGDAIGLGAAGRRAGRTSPFAIAPAARTACT